MHEISISDGGESPTPYISLESAVADAKDGSSIELKFNGVRAVSEKPFRISGKKVTIRRARGYHPPVISFSPRELPAIGFESRMITLNNEAASICSTSMFKPPSPTPPTPTTGRCLRSRAPIG